MKTTFQIKNWMILTPLLLMAAPLHVFAEGPAANMTAQDMLSNPNYKPPTSDGTSKVFKVTAKCTTDTGKDYQPKEAGYDDCMASAARGVQESAKKTAK